MGLGCHGSTGANLSHGYRDLTARMAWGSGSLRERRPGVWEIRVAVGADPVTGRTVQRSFVFHGDALQAALRREELAQEWAERRAIRRATPFLTVGELLERWISAHHDWRSRALDILRFLRFLRNSGNLTGTRSRR